MEVIKIAMLEFTGSNKLLLPLVISLFFNVPTLNLLFLSEWPFSVNLLLPRFGFVLDHSIIGWTIIARRLSGCGSASVCRLMSWVTDPSHSAPLTLGDPWPDPWCDLSPVMTPHELWLTSQPHNLLAIKVSLYYWLPQCIDTGQAHGISWPFLCPIQNPDIHL